MAPFFAVKVDDKVYQLDRLTLGDGVVLKRRFGLTDLESFSMSDVETLIGLLSLAISKSEGIPIAEAQKAAEDIDFTASFEAYDTEAADEPDPTKGGDEATESPSRSGSSAKRQKKPGTPR